MYITLSQYIKNLIAQGENQQLDFKYEISDSRKIARTFSAFANTDGGILLIGVKDNGKIKGIRTDEEIYMIESAADIYCKPKVKYSIEEWHIDRMTILEVKIPKSKTRPHFAKGKNDQWQAFIRINDENFLADYIQIKTWENKSKKKGAFIKYKKEEELLLKYLKENKEITLNRIINLLKIKKSIAQKILINLVTVGIIKIQYSEEETRFILS